MRRTITAAATAALALGLMAGPAAAAKPDTTPADGQCVSAGVKTLGGAAISAVASGKLDIGVPVNGVILDHAFNNADVAESILGFVICE